MTIPYSADYTPPAPVLNVVLRYGDERPSFGPLEAVVDTGADATIIPESIARQLRATPLNPAQLETQWGDVHPVTIYLLDIEVDDRLLPGIVVAGDPAADEIILGRNVLNRLALFLDGPRQGTDVLDENSVSRWRSRREG